MYYLLIKENRYLVMPALSDELNIVGIKTVAPNNPKLDKNNYWIRIAK